MVKIKKAKTTGFCFGVKRAVDMAEGALKTNANVCSMGPIIHNPLVVKELADKGIKAISDIDEAKNATILIRSHGIRPSIRKKITECKIPILDATCPFVEKSHRIVNDLKRNDYYIIIVGEKDHPEVVALAEAAGPKKAIVCSAKDMAKLDIKNKKVALLAQSTLTRALFEEITAAVLKKNPHELRMFDTLCKDVSKRQAEAASLCKKVDLMLVIGGKNSANTKRLAELCRAEGVKTYQMESEHDIKEEWFNKAKSIGVMSGSSTPKKVVDNIIVRIKGVI